jgi:uncharacterized protein (DUF736 family)
LSPISSSKASATTASKRAGRAWRKTSGSGKPYLSIKLDGPTLAEPIYCALTQHPESGAYRLVWNRRERRAATDEAEAM